MTAGTVPVTGDIATYLAQKRRLIGDLEGEVLELGAGRGANFAYLGPHVSWTGLEPSRRVAAALRRRARATGMGDRVLVASAEDLPVPTSSIDAVLATTTLCSVTDQERVLAEVLRVLRPAGRFLFFEHVAAPEGTWTRRGQAAWAPLSRLFDRGCDPTRETGVAIARAGFERVEMASFAMPGPLGSVVPFVAGFGVA